MAKKLTTSAKMLWEKPGCLLFNQMPHVSSYSVPKFTFAFMDIIDGR